MRRVELTEGHRRGIASRTRALHARDLGDALVDTGHAVEVEQRNVLLRDAAVLRLDEAHLGEGRIGLEGLDLAPEHALFAAQSTLRIGQHARAAILERAQRGGCGQGAPDGLPADGMDARAARGRHEVPEHRPEFLAELLAIEAGRAFGRLVGLGAGRDDADRLDLGEARQVGDEAPVAARPAALAAGVLGTVGLLPGGPRGRPQSEGEEEQNEVGLVHGSQR